MLILKTFTDDFFNRNVMTVPYRDLFEDFFVFRFEHATMNLLKKKTTPKDIIVISFP